MKGTLRVIAGSLKGKAIPFVNGSFGDADITPQKVKGAIFSILGEDLDGLVFLDLYSGSGQIGVEAISRGCSLVIFSEFDRKRYSFIRKFLESSCEKNRYIAMNMKASSVMRVLQEKGIVPDVVYLDPPYDKNRDGGSVYAGLIEKFSAPGLISDDGIIVVQHFSKNNLPDAAGAFTKKFTRAYGTTSLSLYVRSGELLDSGNGEVGQ